MAVFTTLHPSDIEALLQAYAVGSLHSFQGIGEGTENSNYFVYCKDGQTPSTTQKYVLTLLEELSFEQAAFHVNLLDTLAENAIPVPRILRDRQGQAVQNCYGKPTLLSTCLEGLHVKQPSLTQCAVIGELLADLHMVAGNITEDYQGTRHNGWLEDCVYQASAFLPESEKTCAASVLQEFLSLQLSELPHGIIHGDLFRDNAFFDGDTLIGIIDFYSAGLGFLLYDLAVVVNDWCRTEDNRIDQPRYHALLNAYTAKRPWTENETLCWSLMLQMAAMRFWLSRLLGQQQAEQGAFDDKNPDDFKQLFYWHRKLPLAHGA